MKKVFELSDNRHSFQKQESPEGDVYKCSRCSLSGTLLGVDKIEVIGKASLVLNCDGSKVEETEVKEVVFEAPTGPLIIDNEAPKASKAQKTEFTLDQIYDAALMRVEMMKLDRKDYDSIVGQMMFFLMCEDRLKLIVALYSLQNASNITEYQKAFYSNLTIKNTFIHPDLETLIKVDESVSEVEDINPDVEQAIDSLFGDRPDPIVEPKAPTKVYIEKKPKQKSEKQTSDDTEKKGSKKEQILEYIKSFEATPSVKEIKEALGFTDACIRHALKAVK